MKKRGLKAPKSIIEKISPEKNKRLIWNDVCWFHLNKAWKKFMSRRNWGYHDMLRWVMEYYKTIGRREHRTLDTSQGHISNIFTPFAWVKWKMEEEPNVCVLFFDFSVCRCDHVRLTWWILLFWKYFKCLSSRIRERRALPYHPMNHGWGSRRI